MSGFKRDMILWVSYADYLKDSNVSMKSHWGGTTNAVVLVLEQEQEELETIRSLRLVMTTRCSRWLGGKAILRAVTLVECSYFESGTPSPTHLRRSKDFCSSLLVPDSSQTGQSAGHDE